jgi:signal transduction histidine kinase
MKKLTIKNKLALWYALSLLFLFGIFVPYLYISMSNIMYKNEEGLVMIHVSQAILKIDMENNSITFSETNDFISSGTYIYLFDLKNRLSKSTSVNQGFTKTLPNYDKPRYVYINKDKWIIFDQPIYNENKIIAWIRGSRSLKPVIETLNNLIIVSLFAIPIYVIIAIAGGLFISRKALSPIDKITKAALEIGHGNLSKRLNLPEVKDEVGRLASTFDEMLNKLEASFNRERQFTSDASHELRTPLAVISAYTEESLSGKRTLSELKENMGVILKESRNMTHMVSQLLFLTRNDEGKTPLEIENINLSVIVNDLCEELRKLASNSKIELSAELEDNLEIQGDQSLVTMALMNVIENAIKYNKAGGKIRVCLSKDSSSAKIIVQDTGIGISKEEIPYIFDRFYRVEKSRSRNGTGLGLSIVKWIVDAHNGSISVNSSPNQGTLVIIQLPIVISNYKLDGNNSQTNFKASKDDLFL